MKTDAVQIQDLFLADGLTLREGLFRLADFPFETAPVYFIEAAWRAWVRQLPRHLQYRRLIKSRWKRCPRWIANAFDCDNHANAFASFLAVRNAQEAARGRRPKRPLAMGVIWYTAEEKPDFPLSGRHAINWFVDSWDRQQTLFYFEPAAGLLNFLRTDEIKTIDFVYGL